MKKIILVLSFIGLIVAAACSSGNDGGDDNGGSNYDRKALLTNWADNIIIPGYVNYQSKLQILVTATATFNTTATVANLQSVRTAWLDAYKAYQYVAMYNIGKAEETNFNMTANTYPTSTTGIDANIASGTYNLALLSQFDKQGLPALDYLINGLGADDAAIVTFYTNNANAANYKNYLTALVTKLKTSTDAIVTDWATYKTTFIANSGSSVSGSVNMMTNLFVKHLEKDVRSGKIGIPAGLSSEGVLFPTKVEAYYKNNVSKELLLAGIQASQDFFNGKHFGSAATGEGLKSFLDFVNATGDGKKLSDVINAQYTASLQISGTLNNSLSEQIQSNNTLMINAYDVLQLNVKYTKLNMMQALNMTIDYVDGDGD
ncbi:imelysin family protein [Flavobacterium sp. N1736]|uniref:imelysin family protein n=1 Tax=Flavobacterium sp. N1736 TaxID=2986823 RepID=UPI0022244A79|nr:imelysin family protein [Flavobacterium sp. N1736]